MFGIFQREISLLMASHYALMGENWIKGRFWIFRTLMVEEFLDSETFTQLSN